MTKKCTHLTGLTTNCRREKGNLRWRKRSAMATAICDGDSDLRWRQRSAMATAICDGDCDGDCDCDCDLRWRLRSAVATAVTIAKVKGDIRWRSCSRKCPKSDRFHTHSLEVSVNRRIFDEIENSDQRLQQLCEMTTLGEWCLATVFLVPVWVNVRASPKPASGGFVDLQRIERTSRAQ
jgi:hypothetical protein